MKLTLLNAVIQAEDYEKVRDWWIEMIDLELKQEWTEKFHYCELAKDGKYVVGIALASEMKAELSTPRNNAVVPQLQVEDAKVFLEELKEKGATVLFGPAHDADEDFWYGAFADVEGNQVWAISLPERLMF